MPSGRFLSKTVSTDDALNALSWQAQALFMMAVPHLDRDGLIVGHPLLLLAQIAPLRAPELVATMPAIVSEWIDAGLVVRYDSAGQPALFFPGFLKHQKLTAGYSREAPSQYEPPPGYERTQEGLIPAAAPIVQPEISAPEVADPDPEPATPELVTSNSGPTPPYKQQKQQKVRSSEDSAQDANSSSSNKRVRARPGPAAAAAGRGGEVKQDIYQLLKAFGVSEPALSDIASNQVTPDQVQGWIDYIATQDLRRPAGYLVKRLRAHELPPDPPDDDDPDSYEALKRKYIPDGWENIVHS